MKPNSNYPGSIFNFDAIPVWIQPDLWDETKTLRFRGLWFVLLYALSMATFSALIFVPIGIYFAYSGSNDPKVTLVLWLVTTVVLGSLLGLATWWDFARKCRETKKTDEKC